MKKIFSILLSLILLLSYTHVTVGTHFCGGEAVESKVILGEANLGCDISDMEKHCGYSENAEKNGNSVEEHPCCNNEYQNNINH